MARLRRSDCDGPGIARKGRGRGFEYFDSLTGEKITDPAALARIRDLVIPPAWRDVWICPHPNGHLQAVGTDAAGRRQYRYHDLWRTRRDSEKFAAMLAFAERLPELRGVCEKLLAGEVLDRDRILACAVRLLDYGFFRIGSEQYAADNDTFGLATMRKEHVTVRGLEVAFDYPSKGGKRRVLSLVDERVSEVVGALRRRRGGGRELFAYRAGRGWVDVTSRDINEFVKQHCGDAYSAKDFRTWHATVLAAVAVAVSGHTARSQTAEQKAVARAIREVAHYLGNTPAVARSSYIDPRVFNRYRDGWTIAGALTELGADAAPGEPSTHGRIEEAVRDLLIANTDSDAVQRRTEG